MIKKIGKVFDDSLIKVLLVLGDVSNTKYIGDKLEKTEYSREAEEIKRLYREYDLLEPKIYLTNSLTSSFAEDMPNAGTTPFGHHVFLSEGLLKLNREVNSQFRQKYGKSLLEHTFAHEIGHLKASGIETLLGDFLKITTCFVLAKFRPFKNLLKGQNKLINLTSELIASALLLNYTNIPVNLIKQHREFDADEVAARLTSPAGLTDTLKTLQERADVVQEIDDTTKTLKETIEDIFKPIPNHPDIDERIKRLEQMTRDNKLSHSTYIT